MAKDIQIKYINDQQEWEELFPVTKTRLVTNNSGQTVEQILTNKPNKNEVYTTIEIDNKLSDLEESLENMKNFDIPVSEVQPEDSKFWFEII